MADTMQFDLVSPERSLVSVPALEVRLPGTDGDLTAMPGHAPVIVTLRPGVVTVVEADGQATEFALTSRGSVGAAAGSGAITAPMPGRVTSVEISAGDRVEKGQRLLTLEAMKMEHALTAPFDGTIAELNAAAGAQVSEGQLLVKVEADA